MIALNETPVFTALDRVAVTFACEVVADTTQPDPRCGFRLAQIYRELFGPNHERKTREPAGPALDRARKLFAGSRSFLDDITTGPPGVNGRPLFLAAELDESEASARAAAIVRPAQWAYEFESTCVQLSPAAGEHALPVTFIDHLCMFESGRIFYVASFGQQPEDMPRLDEYGLIQLERLTFDSAAAANAGYLGFRFEEAIAGEPAEPVSLQAFFANRLRHLCQPDGERPNAIRDVLRPFGILADGEALHLPPQDWLRNGLVQIEDPVLLETARFSHGFFGIDDGSSNDDTGEPAIPEMVDATDHTWQGAFGSDDARTHVARNIDGSTDDVISRPILAFAGLAQGVPDFPRQDYSEVHDSTRPATTAPEGMFFVHPAFELALGVNWRTFRDAQEEVGGCPYAIMAWIIGLHDEVIVADMERRIERMIYGESPAGASATQLGRAEPAADLMRVLRRAASFLRSRNSLIDSNLKSRLEIFRWCSIHRSGNVFRYRTERELLDAIRSCRGTGARFDDAHATLDRYENLVEDLSSLTANYSAVRANWLLGAITVLGMIGLPTTISGTAELLGLAIHPLGATLAMLAFALVLFLIWNRAPRRN